MSDFLGEKGKEMKRERELQSVIVILVACWYRMDKETIGGRVVNGDTVSEIWTHRYITGTHHRHAVLSNHLTGLIRLVLAMLPCSVEQLYRLNSTLSIGLFRCNSVAASIKDIHIEQFISPSNCCSYSISKVTRLTWDNVYCTYCVRTAACATVSTASVLLTYIALYIATAVYGGKIFRWDLCDPQDLNESQRLVFVYIYIYIYMSVSILFLRLFIGHYKMLNP